MELKFTFRRFSPNIYLQLFESAYFLSISVIRIQEFYESCKFRKKFFTLEDYMDWYCFTQQKDSFDYTSEFLGYNLPGKDIIEWAKCFGYAGPDAEPNPNIRDKERQLLEPIWRLGLDEVKNSYFILCSKTDPDLYGTIKHEVAHALYRIDPEYRRTCLEIYKTIPASEKKIIHGFLRGHGYNPYVYPDETQAYFSTGGSGDIKITTFSCYRKYLRNFKQYINSPDHKEVRKSLSKFRPI